MAGGDRAAVNAVRLNDEVCRYCGMLWERSVFEPVRRRGLCDKCNRSGAIRAWFDALPTTPAISAHGYATEAESHAANLRHGPMFLPDGTAGT